MQAALETEKAKNLYSFWGDILAKELTEGTDCVIDLASKEYSTCISRHLPDHVKLIRCVFAEEINGKLVEKGTMCKMARGEMVRYMAENRIKEPEQLTTFDRLQYRFDRKRSDETTFVFLLQKNAGADSAE